MGVVTVTVSGVLSILVLSILASGTDEISKQDNGPGYEILSSSSSQSSYSNSTHMVTIITTTKKSDTNGTITMSKETTYIINNQGNVTTYTVKE